MKVNTTMLAGVATLCIPAAYSQSVKAVERHFVGGFITGGGDFGQTRYYAYGRDAFVRNGLAVALEAGLFRPRTTFTVPLVFAFGPTYHFRRQSRLVPFVSGGHLLAPAGSFRNYGGGATLWLRERSGLRFGLRRITARHPSDRYTTISFGVSIR